MTSDQLRDLEYLIEKSKGFPMSEAQIVQQRRSFAFGNSAIENDKITREMVDEQANSLGL